MNAAAKHKGVLGTDGNDHGKAKSKALQSRSEHEKHRLKLGINGTIAMSVYPEKFMDLLIDSFS